jgi:hypothetical protein
MLRFLLELRARTVSLPHFAREVVEFGTSVGVILGTSVTVEDLLV